MLTHWRVRTAAPFDVGKDPFLVRNGAVVEFTHQSDALEASCAYTARHGTGTSYPVECQSDGSLTAACAKAELSAMEYIVRTFEGVARAAPYLNAKGIRTTEEVK